MGEILRQGLAITGLGMGLVFIMMLALWGIMALLVWLTSRGAHSQQESTPEPAPQSEGDESMADQSQLAAALAVAYAKSVTPKVNRIKSSQVSMAANSQWLNSGRMAQTIRKINRGRK